MNMNTTDVDVIDKPLYYPSTSTPATNEVKLDFENIPSKFDPNSFVLKNMLVTKHTKENYFNQIKNNLYVGAKGIFLVCRDLWEAQVHLKQEDYDYLVKELPLSRSTIVKYESIGRHMPLRELFNLGKLPMNWTTQYYLTTLSQDDFNKVKKIVDVDSTLKDVRDTLQITSANKEEIIHYPFAKVEILKGSLVSGYESLKIRLESFLKEFSNTQVTFDEKTLDKIKDNQKKLDKKSKSERKDKTLNKDEQ